MNNKLLKRILLGITSIVILAGIPAVNAEAATAKSLRTAATVSGTGDNRTVTYTVSVDEMSVSDGRAAVEYDKNVLEYKGYGSTVKFSDVDENKNFKDGNLTGVSYAFVADEPQKANGKILTFKFGVKKGNKDKSTKLKIKVVELNNEDTTIVGDLLLEDNVSLTSGTQSVAAETLTTPKINGVYQGFLCAHINWSFVSNADGYIIYRSNSKDGSYTEIKKVTKDNNYLDSSVVGGKTYYYKVVAYKGTEKNRIYSKESEPKSITIKKIL